MEYYSPIKKTNTSCNMGEPWKLYAKGKKPDTNDHIVYDSVYVECPE